MCPCLYMTVSKNSLFTKINQQDRHQHYLSKTEFCKHSLLHNTAPYRDYAYKATEQASSFNSNCQTFV